MLRTNLSTRPFYNQRALRAAIGGVALVALALSLYNAIRVVSLTARNGELSSRAAESEGRADALAAQSRQIREALNRADVTATAAAADEANLLIDRRAFSWTALFNRFEDTLPGDVRITAVQPQIDKQGRFVLAIAVVSRSVEAVDAFIGEMEKSGSFSMALPVQETLMEDETFRSVIQARYLPAATKPAAASESQPVSEGTADTAAASGAADAAPAKREPSR